VNTPFHRTPHGLSNQAIFANVDMIVFAEGSRHFTFEEIEAGLGNLNTLDTVFWSSIFRTTVPMRRVEVRSVGNKNTVESIAQLVASGTVTNVITALDRDFDHANGRKIVHPNVFYTFGYSWENDVFTHEVVLDFMAELNPSSNAFIKLQEEVQKAQVELNRCYRRVVHFDVTLISYGEEITIRERIEKSVRLRDSNCPTILRSEIASELIRCRAILQKRSLVALSNARVQEDLHGHTVSRWWLGNIHYLLQLYVGVKLSREAIVRLCVSVFCRRSESPSLLHYRSLAANALW
jgi:hypothetical protein